MEGRQTHGVMSAAMATSQEDTDIDKLTRALIIEAYKRPRYQTEEVQREAIIGFRNEAELACYTDGES